MQRGEAMAPFTETQRNAAVRWQKAPQSALPIRLRDSNTPARSPAMGAIGEKRKRPSRDSSDVKKNRAAPGGSQGSGDNDKSPGNNADSAKGRAGGGGSDGSAAKGPKSSGNADRGSIDNGKGSAGNNKNGGNNNESNGNNNNDSNSNSNAKAGNGNNSSKGNGNDNSSKNGNAGSNGNGNNNGNDSSSNGNNGNRNGSGSATTTTAAATSTGGSGSSDSNGAQRFSESVETTATSTGTPPPSAAPTTVLLTTSTIVTTGPDAVVVTSFVPLIAATTALGTDTTAASATALPAFAKPTASDKDNADDKKHRGADSGNSTTSNDNGSRGNNNSRNGGGGNGGNNNGNGKGSTKSLGPAAERALISVGSIGAFIVVCFVFWLVWRAVRKQKRKKMAQEDVSSFQTGGGPFARMSRLPGRLYERTVSKAPFVSKQRKAWHTLEDETSVEKAVDSLEGLRAPKEAPAGNQETGADTPRTLGFASEPPPPVPSKAYHQSGAGLQLQRPPQQLDARGLVESFGSIQPSMPPSIPAAAAPSGNNSRAGGTGAQPVPSVLDVGGQQLLASDASTASGTVRSRMPDPFYNQSQLARQASDAYDPARRQVNRVSELSSLSSGFGDGEMLLAPGSSPSQLQQRSVQPVTPGVPPDVPVDVPPLPPVPTGRGPPPAGPGRLSWARSRRISRETVYTEASDDQPARFRSVTSWVKQQTGRVRRAQASIDTTNAAAGAGAAGGNGVVLVPGNEPGIPHPLPDDQQLTMMDEDEVPRRPDTVPGIQTG